MGEEAEGGAGAAAAAAIGVLMRERGVVAPKAPARAQGLRAGARMRGRGGGFGGGGGGRRGGGQAEAVEGPLARLVLGDRRQARAALHCPQRHGRRAAGRRERGRQRAVVEEPPRAARGRHLGRRGDARVGGVQGADVIRGSQRVHGRAPLSAPAPAVSATAEEGCEVCLV